MTLVKHRPQRTYGEQYIFDEIDVRGLVKVLEQAVDEHGRDGMADTAYYVGAQLAVSTLFGVDVGGEMDMWTDFMRLFEAALEELEGGE